MRLTSPSASLRTAIVLVSIWLVAGLSLTAAVLLRERADQRHEAQVTLEQVQSDVERLSTSVWSGDPEILGRRRALILIKSVEQALAADLAQLASLDADEHVRQIRAALRPYVAQVHELLTSASAGRFATAQRLETESLTSLDDVFGAVAGARRAYRRDVHDAAFWAYAGAGFAVLATLVACSFALVRAHRAQRRAERLAEENTRLLEAARLEATTDSLTGLLNRRKFMADGEALARSATIGRPLAVVVFDLDGFKSYNDRFGHPAGDSLLADLGSRLRDALPDGATAYRMGGDEFCVLARTATPTELVATVGPALCEEGEWFSITSSAGCAIVPNEVSTFEQALQLADKRLYAEKRASGSGPGMATRDALIQVLTEQDPSLGSHVSRVAQLAAATATRLGLDDDDVLRVRLAAELHDIGKAAVPDAILTKPGPLDEREWDFVKRHTLIGSRILAVAPALARVAALVQSSHERVDGGGYPDGLAGDEIPVGARIVAVADAFDAMVSDRPYRKALSVAEAVAELRRCAGSQFDPEVVEAFVSIVEADSATSEAA